MAFFWMKLDAEYIPFLNNGGEIVLVGRFGEHTFWVQEIKMIRMRKVEFRVVRDTFEQRTWPTIQDRIPSHVGNFEPKRIRNVESHGTGIEPAQTNGIPLLAAVRH